ncbi:MAG: type II secretion system minor pseudopilin GspJ [Gammaproteobacteria bacterium]|jgi:general secretion pathway protein J
MTAIRGFTLLEVLIAMAIFSIVGLASFELLRSVRNIDRVTDRQTESYQGLVRTLALMDRDFIQLRYREIRDELGDRKAAVAVNEGYYPIEFTRQGWNNPLQRARSELQRVAYVVEGDSLERHVWFVLDRAQDSEPVSQTLMAGVSALTIYLVMPDGDRVESISGDDLSELPVAIEVTITTDTWGDLIRLYDLPVFLGEIASAVPQDAGESELIDDDNRIEQQPDSAPLEEVSGSDLGRSLIGAQ